MADSKADAQKELNKQYKAGIISQKELTNLQNQLKTSTDEAAAGMLKMLRNTKSVVKEFEKLDKLSQSIKTNEYELIDITSKLQSGLKGNLKDFQGIGKSTSKIVQNLMEGYKAQLKSGKLTTHAYKELAKTAQEAAKLAKQIDKIATSGLGAEFDAAQKDAKAMAGSIADVFNSIPGGAFLFKTLGGDLLEKQLSDAVTAGFAELATGTPVSAMKKMYSMASKMPNISLLLGIGAAIALAVALAAVFVEISHAAHDLSKETGLTYTQSKALVKEANKLVGSGATQLATTKHILNVQKEINKEFGIGGMLSTEQAAAIADIGEAFGYGSEQAGKVNAAFMAMGANVTDATNSQRELAAESLKAGVNVGAVTADIAANAKDVAFYFKGNVKALGKAAVEAAKMGISLKDMAKISQGLLNFEDSISAQFELQALTGRQINLDAARELALRGDIVGASKAVLEQAGSLADLQAMGPIEMKALEKATGMNADQLLRSATIQEKMADLDDDAKASALALGLSAADMANMSADQIQAKAAEADKQKMLNKEMDSMKASLVTALLPAAEAMMQVFKSLLPVFKLIGGALGMIGSAFAFVNEHAAVFKTILSMIAIGFLPTILTALGGLAVAMIPLIGGALSYAAGLLMSAVGAIYTTFSMIPFGLGMPVAIGTAIGLYSMFNKAKAEKVGDMVSPADGKTQVSTKEGGLFELSKNDDLVAGPGMGGGSGGGGVAQALATTNALLRQILEQGTTIEMDGQLVAQAIRTSDSFRRK